MSELGLKTLLRGLPPRQGSTYPRFPLQIRGGNLYTLSFHPMVSSCLTPQGRVYMSWLTSLYPLADIILLAVSVTLGIAALGNSHPHPFNYPEYFRTLCSLSIWVYKFILDSPHMVAFNILPYHIGHADLATFKFPWSVIRYYLIVTLTIGFIYFLLRIPKIAHLNRGYLKCYNPHLFSPWVS